MAVSRQLISAAMFKERVRKGAKASDFDGVSVYKAGALGLKADPDPNSFAVEFILSNANIDREGDSITVEGWSLENYRKNPVVLWSHDHGGLPIAKATKVWRDGKNLKANDDFTDAAGLYPFAATVHAMIRAGLLSAVSVGFQPSEWDESDTGMKFLKQDLLEHSVCPVPAHPDALVVARSKGINLAPLVEWTESVLDLEEPGPLRDQVEQLWRATRTLTGRRKLPPIGSEAGEPLDADPAIVAACMEQLNGYVMSLAPEQRASALAFIQAALDTLKADVTAADDLAPAGGGPRARRRRRTVRERVQVDGVAIEDDPAAQLEKLFASITEDELQKLIDEVVADELMRVTGRVR